ncbi:MAG: ATP synthase F1 subunit epsilon [Candidatus Sumerlaeia bacterium]
MTDFKLQVYTQEKKIYDDDVSSIVVPGLEGYFGVLSNHAPLLTALGRGKLTVRKAGAEKVYEVAGGFIEVRDNVATILADRLTEAA